MKKSKKILISIFMILALFILCSFTMTNEAKAMKLGGAISHTEFAPDPLDIEPPDGMSLSAGPGIISIDNYYSYIWEREELTATIFGQYHDPIGDKKIVIKITRTFLNPDSGLDETEVVIDWMNVDDLISQYYAIQSGEKLFIGPFEEIGKYTVNVGLADLSTVDDMTTFDPGVILITNVELTEAAPSVDWYQLSYPGQTIYYNYSIENRDAKLSSSGENGNYCPVADGTEDIEVLEGFVSHMESYDTPADSTYILVSTYAGGVSNPIVCAYKMNSGAYLTTIDKNSVSIHSNMVNTYVNLKDFKAILSKPLFYGDDVELVKINLKGSSLIDCELKDDFDSFLSCKYLYIGSDSAKKGSLTIAPTASPTNEHEAKNIFDVSDFVLVDDYATLDLEIKQKQGIIKDTCYFDINNNSTVAINASEEVVTNVQEKYYINCTRFDVVGSKLTFASSNPTEDTNYLVNTEYFNTEAIDGEPDVEPEIIVDGISPVSALDASVNNAKLNIKNAKCGIKVNGEAEFEGGKYTLENVETGFDITLGDSKTALFDGCDTSIKSTTTAFKVTGSVLFVGGKVAITNSVGSTNTFGFQTNGCIFDGVQVDTAFVNTPFVAKDSQENPNYTIKDSTVTIITSDYIAKGINNFKVQNSTIVADTIEGIYVASYEQVGADANVKLICDSSDSSLERTSINASTSVSVEGQLNIIGFKNGIKTKNCVIEASNLDIEVDHYGIYADNVTIGGDTEREGEAGNYTYAYNAKIKTKGEQGVLDSSIRVTTTLDIVNSNVSLNSKTNGILSKDGPDNNAIVTIEDSTIEIYAKSNGIIAKDFTLNSSDLDIKVSDTKVELANLGNCGISADGEIAINYSNVAINSFKTGISAPNKDVTIQRSNVTLDANKYNDASKYAYGSLYGIYSSNTYLYASEVYITGFEYGLFGYNLSTYDSSITTEVTILSITEVANGINMVSDVELTSKTNALISGSENASTQFAIKCKKLAEDSETQLDAKGFSFGVNVSDFIYIDNSSLSVTGPVVMDKTSTAAETGFLAEGSSISINAVKKTALTAKSVELNDTQAVINGSFAIDCKGDVTILGEKQVYLKGTKAGIISLGTVYIESYTELDSGITTAALATSTPYAGSIGVECKKFILADEVELYIWNYETGIKAETVELNSNVEIDGDEKSWRSMGEAPGLKGIYATDTVTIIGGKVTINNFEDAIVCKTLNASDNCEVTIVVKNNGVVAKNVDLNNVKDFTVYATNGITNNMDITGNFVCEISDSELHFSISKETSNHAIGFAIGEVKGSNKITITSSTITGFGALEADDIIIDDSTVTLSAYSSVGAFDVEIKGESLVTLKNANYGIFTLNKLSVIDGSTLRITNINTEDEKCLMGILTKELEVDNSTIDVKSTSHSILANTIDTDNESSIKTVSESGAAIATLSYFMDFGDERKIAEGSFFSFNNTALDLTSGADFECITSETVKILNSTGTLTGISGIRATKLVSISDNSDLTADIEMYAIRTKDFEMLNDSDLNQFIIYGGELFSNGIEATNKVLISGEENNLIITGPASSTGYGIRCKEFEASSGSINMSKVATGIEANKVTISGTEVEISSLEIPVSSGSISILYTEKFNVSTQGPISIGKMFNSESLEGSFIKIEESIVETTGMIVSETIDISNSLLKAFGDMNIAAIDVNIKDNSIVELHNKQVGILASNKLTISGSNVSNTELSKDEGSETFALASKVVINSSAILVDNTNFGIMADDITIEESSNISIEANLSPICSYGYFLDIGSIKSVTPDSKINISSSTLELTAGGEYECLSSDKVYLDNVTATLNGYEIINAPTLVSITNASTISMNPTRGAFNTKEFILDGDASDCVLEIKGDEHLEYGIEAKKLTVAGDYTDLLINAKIPDGTKDFPISSAIISGEVEVNGGEIEINGTTIGIKCDKATFVECTITINTTSDSIVISGATDGMLKTEEANIEITSGKIGITAIVIDINSSDIHIKSEEYSIKAQSFKVDNSPCDIYGEIRMMELSYTNNNKEFTVNNPSEKFTVIAPLEALEFNAAINAYGYDVVINANELYLEGAVCIVTDVSGSVKLGGKGSIVGKTYGILTGKLDIDSCELDVDVENCPIHAGYDNKDVSFKDSIISVTNNNGGNAIQIYHADLEIIRTDLNLTYGDSDNQSIAINAIAGQNNVKGTLNCTDSEITISGYYGGINAKSVISSNTVFTVKDGYIAIDADLDFEYSIIQFEDVQYGLYSKHVDDNSSSLMMTNVQNGIGNLIFAAGEDAANCYVNLVSTSISFELDSTPKNSIGIASYDINLDGVVGNINGGYIGVIGSSVDITNDTYLLFTDDDFGVLAESNLLVEDSFISLYGEDEDNLSNTFLYSEGKLKVDNSSVSTSNLQMAICCGNDIEIVDSNNINLSATKSSIFCSDLALGDVSGTQGYIPATNSHISIKDSTVNISGTNFVNAIGADNIDIEGSLIFTNECLDGILALSLMNITDSTLYINGNFSQDPLVGSGITAKDLVVTDSDIDVSCINKAIDVSNNMNFTTSSLDKGNISINMVTDGIDVGNKFTVTSNSLNVYCKGTAIKANELVMYDTININISGDAEYGFVGNNISIEGSEISYISALKCGILVNGPLTIKNSSVSMMVNGDSIDYDDACAIMEIGAGNILFEKVEGYINGDYAIINHNETTFLECGEYDPSSGTYNELFIHGYKEAYSSPNDDLLTAINSKLTINKGNVAFYNSEIEHFTVIVSNVEVKDAELYVSGFNGMNAYKKFITDNSGVAIIGYLEKETTGLLSPEVIINNNSILVIQEFDTACDAGVLHFENSESNMAYDGGNYGIKSDLLELFESCIEIEGFDNSICSQAISAENSGIIINDSLNGISGEMAYATLELEESELMISSRDLSALTLDFAPKAIDMDYIIIDNTNILIDGFEEGISCSDISLDDSSIDIDTKNIGINSTGNVEITVSDVSITAGKTANNKGIIADGNVKFIDCDEIEINAGVAIRSNSNVDIENCEKFTVQESLLAIDANDISIIETVLDITAADGISGENVAIVGCEDSFIVGETNGIMANDTIYVIESDLTVSVSKTDSVVALSAARVGIASQVVIEGAIGISSPLISLAYANVEINSTEKDIDTDKLMLYEINLSASSVIDATEIELNIADVLVPEIIATTIYHSSNDYIDKMNFAIMNAASTKKDTADIFKVIYDEEIDGYKLDADSIHAYGITGKKIHIASLDFFVLEEENEVRATPKNAITYNRYLLGDDIVEKVVANGINCANHYADRTNIEGTYTPVLTADEHLGVNQYDLFFTSSDGKYENAWVFTGDVNIYKIIEIVWDTPEYTFNEDVQEITAHYVDLESQNVDLKVTTNKEFKEAGTYVATASFKNNEEFYILPEVYTKEYVINPYQITEIIWDNTEIEYTGNEGLVYASYVNAKGDYVSLIATCDEEFINVGTYTISASFMNGEMSYLLPDDITTEAKIYPATITILWEDDDLTYNGQAQNINAYYMDRGSKVKLLVVLDKEAIDVGTYTATAKFAYNETNYIMPSVVTTTFNINPMKVDIHWSDDLYTFNGNVQVVEAYFVGADGKNVSLNVAMDKEFKDAGSYTATASMANANNNYELPQTLTHSYHINKKLVEVEWDKDEYVFNGLTQKVHAFYKDVNGEKVELNVSMDKEFKDAGEYKALASFANNETNYELPQNVANNYHINKANITLTWAEDKFDYNGNVQTIKVTYVDVNGVEQEALVTIDKEFKNAGIYNASATVDSNYQITNEATHEYHINKIDYDMSQVVFNDVTTDDRSGIYNITIDESKLPVGLDGIKLTVEYTGSIMISDKRDPGVYVINAVFATESENYNIPESITVKLTILRTHFVYEGEKINITVDTVEGVNPYLLLAVNELRIDEETIQELIEGVKREVGVVAFEIYLVDFFSSAYKELELPEGAKVVISIPEELKEQEINLFKDNNGLEAVEFELGEDSITINNGTMGTYVMGYTKKVNTGVIIAVAASSTAVAGGGFGLAIFFRRRRH